MKQLEFALFRNIFSTTTLLTDLPVLMPATNVLWTTQVWFLTMAGSPNFESMWIVSEWEFANKEILLQIIAHFHDFSSFFDTLEA